MTFTAGPVEQVRDSTVTTIDPLALLQTVCTWAFVLGLLKSFIQIATYLITDNQLYLCPTN